MNVACRRPTATFNFFSVVTEFTSLNLNLRHCVNLTKSAFGEPGCRSRDSVNSTAHLCLRPPTSFMTHVMFPNHPHLSKRSPHAILACCMLVAVAPNSPPSMQTPPGAHHCVAAPGTILVGHLPNIGVFSHLKQCKINHLKNLRCRMMRWWWCRLYDPSAATARKKGRCLGPGWSDVSLSWLTGSPIGVNVAGRPGARCQHHCLADHTKMSQTRLLSHAPINFGSLIEWNRMD